ncbi:MAG: hypothetical protein J2P37_10415 [Ktedonobacteraceae bacterium]|nr:hypothetical protein [Ktedonobacteraceae bacterium]MBO0792325.1 hypothetical protein [Ktedonobacteraceae bacterium]
MPQDQAQLIQACKTIKRFMEVVELTDEELKAIQDNYGKLEEAVQRTEPQPAPTMLQRRAKGESCRGIPLTVFNKTQLTDASQRAGSL